MKNLRCTYDKEANAFYIKISKKKVAHTLRLGITPDTQTPNLLLDRDKNGQAVGLEILLYNTKLT